jgi:prephenate dehydrogenase
MEDKNQVEPDFFTGTRIAIIGLGLMGGSLALGMRDRCKEIVAADPDPTTRDLAIERNIVSHITAEPSEILPDTDLVILAAPVSAIIDLIHHLPDYHPGSPVVIDLGSTKDKICKEFQLLPPRIETVGGHPMCGKAVSGLAHAEAGIFQDAPFALTPTSGTTERAREVADQLAFALGANPVWIGPNTHDNWVAVTSHLPYLLSSALALATPTEAAQLIGPGFLSTSRLVSSPSSIMVPILSTNRVHVLEAINLFRYQMDNLEATIKDNEHSKLKEHLDAAADHHSLLTIR